MYLVFLFWICRFIYLFTLIYRYLLLARADAMEALVNGYDSGSNALRDIHNSLAIILKQDMKLGYLGTKWTGWRQFCWIRSGIHYLYGSTTWIKFSKALMFIWKKKVVDLMDSFEKFLKSLGERYEELELEAKNLCGNTQYE